MARLIMIPSAGERLLRFVGDRVRFTLRTADGAPLPEGWRAFLRTNIGRARLLRHEIIHSYPHRPPLAGAAWHDVPLERCGAEWWRDVTLTETGFFRAKAYAVDPEGWQHWTNGDDAGVSVHPNEYRTANTIYCAFTRMFGKTKHALTTADPELETRLSELDAEGYTVIPQSGKLRDLIRELPFIIDTLGCRIVQLLPVNPTPTTYAKFGRFGSPYASQDLTAIDPALVEFDKRTTGVDQFRELTYAAHAHGGRVFLDIVINHTGWGARLQETHPEWYVRDAQGNFVSPGAWGVTWQDLAELDHRNPMLWEELADVFLTWCRRGVDGFRCDAGYKVPLRAWRYITARVLDEFPSTVFLLEGLGGSWEATELLLTEGGMQWAYSELFQNYSGLEVASYLEYALQQSQRLGVYAHYSETHDNLRLADRGAAWSLMRNRLCALTSVAGAFGFTCGVEWLATERINVHSNRALAWGQSPNLVPELAQLNELLRSHPSFFDGARLSRVSAPDSPVYALLREAAEGGARVLVVINTDADQAQHARFDPGLFASGPHGPFATRVLIDLLGQTLPPMQAAGERLEFIVPPAACYCLAVHSGHEHTTSPSAPPPQANGRTPAGKFGTTAPPAAMSGIAYRRARAQAAWAVTALSRIVPAEEIGAFDWRVLADWVERDPRVFLGSLRYLDPVELRRDLLAALFTAMGLNRFPQVVTWQLLDRRRVTVVPHDHWLLLCDTTAFRATLDLPGTPIDHVQSMEVAAGHVACFAPRANVSGEAQLMLERYAERDQHVQAAVRFVAPEAAGHREGTRLPERTALPLSKRVLLTNGRGGMARLCLDFGSITSKYDCLLGANLHPEFPVDRHIFAKRARLWINADGFITPLTAENLIAFKAGPPAHWHFIANAGNARAVAVDVLAEMVPDSNTTVLRFQRSAHRPPVGHELPAHVRVSITARVDIEDRNFHWETKFNGSAEHHFAKNTRPIAIDSGGRYVPVTPPDAASTAQASGFEFTPAPDRQLRVFVDRGRYLAQPEWCHDIPHPIEASRGQEASGDAYSPGWFDIPLERGETAALVVTAESAGGNAWALAREFTLESEAPHPDDFEQTLLRAVQAFVVRRGEGKTVIAGYPWFLDWGRDTLICLRGLLAAGMVEDVRATLLTFARFEENGTLPNTIHGANASNRDTSDAPLWFGIAVEDVAALDAGIHREPVDGGRTISDVLRSIALNYMRGTSNGIHMDTASALVWSPSHFTWMDTNYPAGSPREGYPVEIQVFWIRLLRQLERIGAEPADESWSALAARAEQSLRTYYWLEHAGYFADVLLAPARTPARAAIPDEALRSNGLFTISLGLVTGEPARRTVENALRYLVVPGALRSLAPLPVAPPLAIHGAHGQLLNDPTHPYWGRYEGDEDTQRKPAYHNGTAWTWTLPSFCEALVRAWGREPEVVAAARAYLRSMRYLTRAACIGHLPEILDGDAPHVPRGCDAQSWSATEALRVWKWLNGS